MKWFYRFILPLLLLLSVEVKSQTYTYHSFPDSNITWQGYYGCGVHSNVWKDFWIFNVTGDTSINGILYHNIGNAALADIGCIRETADKKVYFFNYSDFDTCSHERLLYDFSLSVGDVFPMIYDTLTVFAIDTPLYFGIPRRTIHFFCGTLY